jgi:hypothetical protein
LTGCRPTWLPGAREHRDFAASASGVALATSPLVASGLARTVMLLTVAAAVTAPGAARAARVEELALHEGDKPTVELRLSEPVATELRRLSNPPRVYVDLRGTTVAPTVARAIAGGGIVRKVRIGNFDAQTVRLVVELASASPVDFGSDGNTVSLTFRPGAAAAPVAKTAQKPAKVVSTPGAAARASDLPADEPRLTVVRLDEPLAPSRGAPPTAGTPEAPAVAWPTGKPSRSDASARSAAPAARADAQAAAMPTVVVALQERIARRAATEDWAGVVALYGANTDAIRHEVDSTARASVADALRELGLGYAARKLLGPVETNEAPALRIARAELDAHDGAIDDATSMLVGLDDATVDPALVPKLRRLRTRLALARGDVEAAATSIGNRAAPELRAEIAHAALESGRAAMDKRVCRQALVAYRQALDADGGRTARTAAAAGLVRAALSCRDAEATMQGLGVLAESPHPLLRRAASVIAATQTDEARETAIHARSKRGG